MFGNGLRGHIWKEFQDRFGIERIIELYGATEGNANISKAVILEDGLFIRLPCKAVSTSATFIFTMDALPVCFLSATDPVSRNHCPKRVIVDACGPGYFC
ncbi:hypothetical protein TNCV_1971871 [Trichonephila clavipes]|nr:hypothetical protein TNCV_1971871 [Trichonephila clavipes]